MISLTIRYKFIKDDREREKPYFSHTLVGIWVKVANSIIKHSGTIPVYASKDFS